jgi:hypothetical protein
MQLVALGCKVSFTLGECLVKHLGEENKECVDKHVDDSTVTGHCLLLPPSI